MTAKPPSDDSQLPKLRRFRFLPDDPKVAREIGPDGRLLNAVEAEHDAPTTHGADPNEQLGSHKDVADADFDAHEDRHPQGNLASHEDFSDDGFGAHQSRQSRDNLAGHDGYRVDQDARATAAARRQPGSDDDLRESEQLLAALESPLGRGPITAPTSQDDVRAVPPPTADSGARGADVGDSRSPVAAGSAPNQRAGRAKSWPFLAAGVVLAVIIAGVVWFVTRPGDEQGVNEEGAAQEPTATSELTAADWADSMCTELTEFQTTVMPLRAETAKASASSAATEQNVDQLRRQASELLTDLAAELQQVGMPTDSTDAAGVHTTVLSAVNAAASSANPSISPSPADTDVTPAEAATEVLSALDRPLVVFQQAVSDLAEDSRDEISSAPACSSLL